MCLFCSFARHNRTEINAQTETNTKVDNTCHLDIVSSFYWISFQAVKQNRYLSVCHSALALSQAVAKERRRLRMESKANKNSHVLMFGLSVNLILTLGSLGFTCYSLHRLDSRLTTLERNSPLKNSPYQISDPFSVAPTSAHFRPSGPLEKETGRVQRAVERPSMCHKCSSVCVNLNGQRGVSFTLLSFLFFKCHSDPIINLLNDLPNLMTGFNRKKPQKRAFTGKNHPELKQLTNERETCN